jgi:membrane associated rhomboid family serine protease
MFISSDDNPTQSYPWVNHSLIAANIAIYAWQVFGAGLNNPAEVNFCFVPDRFLHHFTAIQLGTVMSAMFMHASLGHLLGNMWYLFIFGDNVEDRMGKLNYFCFYIACGYLAALTHILIFANSSIPSLGASGAISGVLAAYLVLFPGVNVRTYVTWFIRVGLPAWFLIGAFFVMQCISCYFDLDKSVGWFAHLGGFIGGILLLKLVMRHAETPGKNLEAPISQSALPLSVAMAIVAYGIGVVILCANPHKHAAIATTTTTTTRPATVPVAVRAPAAVPHKKTTAKQHAKKHHKQQSHSRT